jgi:TniQ
MAACWGDVVESVGLISAGAESARDCVADWLRGLSAAQVLAVSTATGISAEQVAAMTFQGLLNRAAGSGGLRGSSLELLLWMRGWRSRFCAACLSENAGRWALWWRLRWAFACLEEAGHSGSSRGRRFQ